VNVICLSPTRLAVAAADQPLLDRLIAAMHPVATATVSRNVGMVAVVGDGIVGNAAAWRLVNAARDAGHVIDIVAAQSGDALVCVTGRQAAPRVLAQLHQTVFGDAEPQRRPRRRAEVKGEDATGTVQPGAGA
jgi:hypothetical protein